MEVNLLSGHRVVPNFGLAGGLPGELGRNSVVRTRTAPGGGRDIRRRNCVAIYDSYAVPCSHV